MYNVIQYTKPTLPEKLFTLQTVTFVLTRKRTLDGFDFDKMKRMVIFFSQPTLTNIKNLC